VYRNNKVIKKEVAVKDPILGILTLFHCFGVEVHRTLCVVVKIELHDLPRVVTVVVTLVCPTNVEFAR
jgi:hypothetical protein